MCRSVLQKSQEQVVPKVVPYFPALTQRTEVADAAC